MAATLESARDVRFAAGKPHVQCPHCHERGAVKGIAYPDTAAIRKLRPAHVGAAGMCGTCGEPVFMRLTVRRLGPDGLELTTDAEPVERPRENFADTYLPPAVGSAFNDALACYSHGLYGAFGAMCRLTARRLFADLGENGKLRAYDIVAEARDFAEIDDRLFSTVRHTIFDSDADDKSSGVVLDKTAAAVLLEVMKDLLTQAYVRGEKIRKALKLRMFLADPGMSNLELLGTASGDDESR